MKCKESFLIHTENNIHSKIKLWNTQDWSKKVEKERASRNGLNAYHSKV